MRYLVATDGSTEGDAAVRYAAKQAAIAEATLEIVHVLVAEPELVGGEMVFDGTDDTMDRGRQILERSASLATGVAGELQIETELLTGRPAASIAERSEQSDADAIYVGHRGLSEEREQVVGSVAKSVVDKATVPVTVVK
ncbi:MAG: universal stress protein [Natronomonas sp.]